MDNLASPCRSCKRSAAPGCRSTCRALDSLQQSFVGGFSLRPAIDMEGDPGYKVII